MGYFKDVFDMMLLKDDAYRRVGNSKKSFKRFFGATLLSIFIIELLSGVIGFIYAYFFAPEILQKLSAAVIVVLFFMALIFPLIYFLMLYIFTLISHAIGLMFGGRPRSYNDFLTVSKYHYPVVGPFTIFWTKILRPIYLIWYCFVLYKTYRIIHKLSPSRAGWALAVNIVLYLIFVVLMLVLVFYMMKNNPAFAQQVYAKSAYRGY